MKRVSVIIPNRNGANTLARCLEAVLASDCADFEVVVVDDASTDSSVDIIRNFPCSLVALGTHAGASGARNAGVRASTGEILFFIDADCVVDRNTVANVARLFEAESAAGTVFGGTYAPRSYEDQFFGNFQAAFIHYSEMKRAEPDYVATHALSMLRKDFDRSGGFRDDFLPILEDVEFSHRLRRMGMVLRMAPGITVRHIFGYSLSDSLRNAFRKTKYWTVYSLRNRDLHRDSGTASLELKTAVVCFYAAVVVAALSGIPGWHVLRWFLPGLAALNLGINRDFVAFLVRVGGWSFAAAAAAYYFLVYPLAVGPGGLAGILQQTFSKERGH